MCFVPLPERMGVDLDDAAFDEGVGSDKFVIGGVVDLVEYDEGYS